MPPFLNYFWVLLISSVKFLAGPISALGLGLNVLEGFLCIALGMMCSVSIFTYLGNSIKNNLQKRFFRRKKKLFNNRNRRAVAIWRKYGLIGVAFLTPIFFSPIIGTLISVSFGEVPRRIISYMFLSAVFWSAVLVSFTYFFANIVRP